MFLRQSMISENNNIKELLKHCHYNTCILLDIDDTIVTQRFGDPWFEKLLQKVSSYQQPIDEVISIYHAVQNITQMNLIEKEIVKFIKAFQDIGLPVIALTSRGIPIMTSTLRELHKIGVHFDRQWGATKFDLEVDGKKEISQFKDGIIFCTGYDKGKCLAAFLKTVHFYPKEVVMIDDKNKHLESVKKVVNAYGGTFRGIRYSQMDTVAKEFDLEKAQVDLEELKPQFSVEDQQKLNHINSVIFPGRFFKKEVNQEEVNQVILSSKHEGSP